MNKKFFSAVLMGALLLGGTFVSCQDYDDDIENLQNQIDKLASADQLSSKVSELQSAISAAQSAAEAKAAAANTVAEAAKKAAGDADAKAAAAQKAADDVKAAAGNYATKEEATAAANAAQKVANDLAAALEGALTEADVNAAINTALEAALAKYATTEALQAVADELAKIQEAIAKCASEDDLKALADKVAAIETAGVPGVAAAAASVAAPANLVRVMFDYAKWNPSTKADEVKIFNKLAEAYPEIKDIEKNTLMKQGGHLPVVVNPSNVDLTEGYAFALQTVDGKEVADVTVSAPEAGLIGATLNAEGVMETKAAGSCFWTLKAEPKQISKGAFATVAEAAASLVVESEDGTALKTAFAYVVNSKNVKEHVSIAETGQAMYAEKIDLLVPATLDVAPVQITGLYMGYQLITLTNAYEIKKYGLSIEDNRYLVIENMPADVNNILVHLKVVALGLNGSAAEKPVTLTVTQKVGANTEFSDKEVELTGKKQKVEWAFEEFDITDPIVLDNLMRGTCNIKVTLLEEKNDNETIAYDRKSDGSEDKTKPIIINNKKATFWNAKGEETAYSTTSHTWSNNEPETFGFYVNASAAVGGTVYRVIAPRVYQVEFLSTEGESQLFAAPATLTTSLPEDLTKEIRIAEGFNEDGMLRVIGEVSDTAMIGTDYLSAGKVKYALANAFVLAQSTSFVEDEDGYVFVDNVYNPDATDTRLASYYNYVTKTANKPDSLKVNIWQECTTANGLKAAQWNQFGPRSMSANIKLWNNDSIITTFDFKTIVKSPIYDEKGATVTFDNTKLAAKYGDDAIEVQSAVKSAVYAAGPQKGQAYTLFAGEKTSSTINYAANPNTLGNYVLNKDGMNYVLVSEPYYIEAFGWPLNYPKAAPDGTSHKLTLAEWQQGRTRLDQFFTVDEKGKLVAKQVYAKRVIATDTWDFSTYYYDVVADGTTATGRMAIINPDGMINVSSTNSVIWEDKWTDPTESVNITVGYYWKKVDLVEVLGFNSNAFLVAIKKFYEQYVGKISFPSTSLDEPVNIAQELLCEPTIEFKDAKEASKYVQGFTTVNIDGTYVYTGGLTVQPKDISDVIEAPEKVEIPMNLVVKDIWGKTMKVPFSVVITTK